MTFPHAGLPFSFRLRLASFASLVAAATAIRGTLSSPWDLENDSEYAHGDFASAAASGVPGNRGARTLDVDPDYVAGPGGSQANNFPEGN